ncbi:hypothetical protein [Weissella minor]|nr:hypothetical protein [Weissella minor]
MTMQRRLEVQIIGTIDNKQKKHKQTKGIHKKKQKPHKSKLKTQVATY